MKTKQIRLAIIGTGAVAGWHALRYGQIKHCKLVACCDTLPGRAAAFAKNYGIPAAYEDAEKMLAQEQLDAVSVATPDRAHAPAALLAIRHGLHVLCEKPLASNLSSARRMEAAARKKKLLTAVNFSYRNSPATQKAAQLVAHGKLGRILHVEGSYLQSWLISGDWRKRPGGLWRLSTRHGSNGVLGDLGVHLYDLASFVVGDFAALACELKTFGKGVPRIGEYVLDANDSMVTSVRFRNGAIGTLHSSRWATGHANSVALRVYGDQGALDLNLDRPAPETLRVCLGSSVAKNAWQPLPCPATPDMFERFVVSLVRRRQAQTSFAIGVKVQSYLESSSISAKKGGVFVRLP